MNNKRTIAQAAENLIQGNTSDAVPRITESKRTGRPTNEAGHIALLAHFQMCRHEISGEASVKRRRVIAAKAIGFGNIHSTFEMLENNARKVIRNALKHLQGEGDIITYAGDNHGNGRAWLAVQDEHEGFRSIIKYRGDGRVDVKGFGWLCEWGERRARFGFIQSNEYEREPSTSIISVAQRVEK